MHRLYSNIHVRLSFQNFPNKLASATISSLWYKRLNFIDFMLMQISVMIRGKHYQATNKKIDSLLWEKYEKKPYGNVKMSNKKGDVPAVHLYILR